MTQPLPCSAGKPGEPLSIDSARLRALAATPAIHEAELLAAGAALHRVVALPPRAGSALPPFDNAAMDGFAVATADLCGPGPWRLPLSARIVAGDTRRHALPPGTAARIMTGAAIPSRADAVVMRERVRVEEGHVVLDTAPKAGLNIRRCGEDIGPGQDILQAGDLLTPQRLGLLAGAGVTGIRVVRQVRVGLFSTGEELREPGEALSHGQIYNSNRPMLRALLAEPWLNCTDYGIVPDNRDLVRARLREAAAGNDIVISSGGVSAGEEDHILDAMIREQAELHVLKVAIRPGKPLTIGRIGGALFIGLPGNPYAALVTFNQIARPALRRAAGLAEADDTWLPAVAGFTVEKPPGRREYLPVEWSGRDGFGRPVLTLLGRGASARLAPVSRAMGIAVLPEDLARVVPGTPLRVDVL